ncbi:MAG: hypothetical protein AAF642_08340 [Pseudomonadota bacterium]
MLRLPYLLNILILVPVCWAMYSGTGRTAVFEGKVSWSDDLASLVAALWTAILVASLAGLVWPRLFVPLLLVQVIYKSLFLAIIIVPLARQGSLSAVPMGITVSFALIVLTYPWAIWMAWKPA